MLTCQLLNKRLISLPLFTSLYPSRFRRAKAKRIKEADLEKYRHVFHNLNQMSPKPLLPGLNYGQLAGGHSSQLSLAAAAVQLASAGQLNAPLNGQLSSPVTGQPPLFQFPTGQPPQLGSPAANGLVSSNGLIARDDEGTEYLKHLNTLHYIKQLQQQQQQQQQNNPISSSIKSEPPIVDENCSSSPKLANGQSSTGCNGTKLAKPQPVRHHSNTNGLQSVPTSK